MKKNKIIVGIFIAIFVVIVFDVSLILLSKRENKIPKESEQETKDVIYVEKYFCTRQNQKSVMTNNNSFASIEEYEFMVINNEINQGKYKDTISLENEDNYNYFLTNYINKNNSYFTIEYDEKNYKVIYSKDMIFNNEEKDSLTFSEEYLNYLENLNFQCEKKET